MAAKLTLPQLPAKHRDLPSWIQSHPDTPLNQIIAPYNDYDAVVRKLFAQERSHAALQENHLNIVPLYDSRGVADVRVRARDLASELSTTKERYIMPLKEEDRRLNGSLAVVPRFEDFRGNFNIFSEGALSDMDWSNVVVAGSAVVTCLLPVPEKYRDSKRALREYYHEKIAPASDVDLFLYGLDEAQAIEKIKQIEYKVKNSILYETTTVRTRNTITIVSQYPTRHVQIVLRIYKSVAEILTGFDVDCACAAFDGKQVFASPRALASYITQINPIDLSRRSPSYENRLSKYSHRGFEIFWPELDRSQVDPTIFERSFTRVVGLARLLVLEKLPKSSDRESYIEQRRQERGRPARRNNIRQQAGNIKDDWVDEVPEWEEGDQISDYNTFTLPYGSRFKARKIEKLLYTKDLLINAEWNKPKDRQVNLHRHPAFFGDVVDVVQDCCGCCPQPETEEEKETAEKESKIYVSGNISFVKDDPGRQEIGSFNPITETDWTEMAYVGNTERLCQAIVNCDIEGVEACLTEGTADPNNRDYTGRTPLHLACLTSTPEIVQCLLDHGARLISRLADGRTALHLAAARGSLEIVRILLRRSEQNEAEQSQPDTQQDGKGGDESEIEEPNAGGDQSSCTSGSFIHVDREIDADSDGIDLAMCENEMEPDIYDINVVSWDIPTSALHLAILNGHVDVVNELVASFGADVLLPVKLFYDHSNSPRAAILNLALALRLPLEKVNTMTEKLLQLGALPTQADLGNVTPLHYVAASDHADLLDTYLNHNRPATMKAINYLVPSGYSWRTSAHSALMIALLGRNSLGATKLLGAAAQPSIDFESFVKPGQGIFERIKTNSSDRNKEIFRHELTQPIILAVQKDLPVVAVRLLDSDVDPNELTPEGYNVLDDVSCQSYTIGQSVLDCVRDKIAKLRNYHGENLNDVPPLPLVHPDHCLNGLELGTYQMWTAEKAICQAKMRYEKDEKKYAKAVNNNENRKGLEQKFLAVRALLEEFEGLETALVEKGAKPFYDLFPECERPGKEISNPGSPRTEPFKVEYNFSVPDLTDTRKKAYFELFEAAWRGDLETIKTLTLVATGDENHQSPLQIAVRDQNRFSPFSIAILRGHQHIAKAILEIAQAQFKREASGTYERYEMDLEAFHEDAEIRLYSEIIDDRFTIENIGETAMQVECEISPLQIFSWDCPVSMFTDEESDLTDLVHYAIWKNDVDLLEFILQLGQELTQRDNTVETQIFTISTSAFRLAIKKGHLGCLEAIIRYTGAELQADNLLQDCGIKVKEEKPRFYPGLSIRGKKRADWAAAGRGMTGLRQRQEDPLLIAAFLGSLSSVQWFLSSAPIKTYVKFIKGHEQDDKLKLLSQSVEDMEGPLMGWIQSRNDFILHCAVLSKPTQESCQLVEYLVKSFPQSIETKSAAGHTPLSLAFSLDQVEFARILIKAGANQATRDRKGNNLVHLLLSDTDDNARGEPGNMERLLALLDTRLIPSLLTERSSNEPGSLTPIARWMHQSQQQRCRTESSGWEFDHNRETDGNLAVVRCFLEFAQPTGQKHLDMFDGTGNTPLHEAVKQQSPRIFKAMAGYRPDLLYRENATGSTPLELAVDNWVAEALSNPPPILVDGRQSEARHEESSCVLDRQPESFDPGYPTKRESERQAIYKSACERARTSPHKRILVSLNEANEVAKRLAARKEREMFATVDRDVVTQWYHHAVWYGKGKLTGVRV
ncbi:ankyrin repeat protein [Aspergillus sclerotiicarbonarius CBS 121057]|uniref:Ankyrin repeat protein n=1 Tax=Aspergillus sclerotiicarbonarius (strain CBS 121057 / IBT 28362) TaxID=1448318 RepID=A0A319E6E6_ASPSB|nr:ankyrin repeat protein [Aspergillus sclerotiicarbonarius CBS 121057]